VFKKLLIIFIKILSVFFILALLIAAYLFIETNAVVKSRYSVYSSKLPPVFHNYNLALITDFHNSDNVDKILKKVEDIDPKIIIIAGDAISMNDTEYGNVGLLTDGLIKMAPVYFTSGNHETWSKNEKDFLNYLKGKDVNLLNNSVAEIRLENSSINLIGYKDIIYSDDKMRYDILDKELGSLYDKIKDKDLFNLLVFHRANYFDAVAKYPFDLVLSGHLHGGQVNLPVIKDKILMRRVQNADYSKGYYRVNSSQMVVSAGLEKNYKYPRVFNPAEVVEVVLKHLD
jgi:predicted MPP superfamily phosphohydrolase